MEKEVEELTQKLHHLEKNQVVISKEEKQKITLEHSKSTKEWRKRKRIVMGILDAIMEGWPKSKKELYDEIGIETDEDVGIKLSAT